MSPPYNYLVFKSNLSIYFHFHNLSMQKYSISFKQDINEECIMRSESSALYF